MKSAGRSSSSRPANCGFHVALPVANQDVSWSRISPTCSETREVIAARAHKKAPRGSIPSGIARALLRTPGLAKMARAPLAFLDAFNHMAFYNCRNTLEDLRATGIHCPSFDRYVDNLIGYVREVHAQRKQKLDAEVFDPFD